VLSLVAKAGFLYTGCNDKNARIWKMVSHQEEAPVLQTPASLLESLRDFVKFKTVSADPSLSQECRRCAKFLRDLFAHHGALTKLASGQEGRNPLLLAKFIGQEVFPSPPTLSFSKGGVG